MRPPEITPALDAKLAAKVASMSKEEIEARMYAIADAADPATQPPELVLEFAKLFLGSDAKLLWDAEEEDMARQGKYL